MKKLAKIIEFLLYILPAILFFSYYPRIFLGNTENMHLELSLPLIWLVIFDVITFIFLIKKRQLKANLSKKFIPILLFPLYFTISIIWSTAKLRAILIAGVAWLLIFAIFAIIVIIKSLPKKSHFKEYFEKTFIVSFLLICAWCWLQSILDVCNLSQSITLMCDGCTSDMFGFPHPNGFTLEPQFMGNLLLAPSLLCLYRFINKPSKKYALLSFIFVATLFLTFSRGAIYSFIAASLILLIVKTIQQKSARPLHLLIIIVVAFLFSLNAQGLMAQFSITNDTYQSGIAKSLSQLSLGYIDIDYQTTENPSATSDTTTENISSTFTGYVEESTDFRIEGVNRALAVWSSSPTTILFGVGYGAAGQAMYDGGYMSSAREIVQNEYVSILLELGLVGIGFYIVTIIFCIKLIRKTDHAPFIYILLIAYALSLLFFSGLPNALHIYLFPTLLALMQKSR